MAVLLNQTSNLRLRVELVGRLSDGVHSPAALEMVVALERYRRRRADETAEPGYVPLVALPRRPLLDLDLIAFLERLEDLLDPARASAAADAPGPREAALGATLDPALGLRIEGGPEAFLVEAGLDLQSALESVAGVDAEPGANLLLARFPANGRAVLAFCSALLSEFAKFPTDPARVAKGSPFG